MTYLTPENIGDREIALGFNNLELLCLNCHNKKTFKAAQPDRILLSILMEALSITPLSFKSGAAKW
ncbi:HNH endonuclease [Salipaludibacillus sp. HK11]|uniref:HNH endonuclease n=1 Tax=Salipaludibacillus sp. HK11 TaxID=3394320 RepID=UPI0039FCAF31